MEPNVVCPIWKLGGGIYIDAGLLTMHTSVIQGNSAPIVSAASALPSALPVHE